MSQTYKGYFYKNRTFLIVYNTGKSPKLLCKLYYEDPIFVNDSVVKRIFNIETGEQIH